MKVLNHEYIDIAIALIINCAYTSQLPRVITVITRLSNSSIAKA